MTQNNEREAFEAKINSFNRGQKLDLTPHHDTRFGTYLSDHTECAFRAFKSISQNEPQAIPEGWRLVPIEPTHEMLLSVLYNTEYAGDNESLMTSAYKAMINAAPTTSLTSETNTEVRNE